VSPSSRRWELSAEARIGLIAAAVERFSEHTEDLLDEMTAAAIVAAPRLAGDGALEESVRASVRAMTVRWVEAQRRRPGHPVPVDVPPEALDVARDLVRHGVDFQQLLIGYRSAENVGCRRWLIATSESVPADAVATIAEIGLRSINDWIDAALSSIVRQIDQERDELVGDMRARRLETVTLILEGAPIREDEARDRLGYELSGWHTGLVLWFRSANDEQGLIEKTVRLLALAAGLRPPLVLSVTATTSWVWLTADRPIEAESLRPHIGDASDLFIAAGTSKAGMAGFRRTHREALAARRVVEGSEHRARFTAYEEVRIADLASHDTEAVADFISETLGQLANADLSLRETLRVYLQEDGNTARTAARLFTHRNTILNRVDRAQQLLPLPLSGRRLNVGLALELHHWSSRRLTP
jgi:DNA-binding PucR family transcriptional regulator